MKSVLFLKEFKNSKSDKSKDMGNLSIMTYTNLNACGTYSAKAI